jgi:RNase P protein component
MIQAYGLQHGHMVGDVLGIGRTDADVDHRDATAIVTQQVVAGHLRQPQRLGTEFVARLRVQADTAGHHIAGFDKCNIFAVTVLHRGAAQAYKLIDIELVVGEQHEVLEVLRRGSRVVAQPVQRVVDPRRGEQGQRFGVAITRFVCAVGDAVVHRGQVRQVERVAHQLAPFDTQAAFDMVVLGKRKMYRYRLVAGSNFQLDPMVVQQQRELIEIVVSRTGRAGSAWSRNTPAGNETIAQPRTVVGHGADHGMGLHPHIGITGPRAVPAASRRPHTAASPCADAPGRRRKSCRPGPVRRRRRCGAWSPWEGGGTSWRYCPQWLPLPIALVRVECRASTP